MVNRYATFVRDIEPQGFDLVVMDGYLTKKIVQKVKEIIAEPEKRGKVVTSNYKIAARHYSYSVLRKHLNSIMINFFGEHLPPHMQKVVSYLAQHLINSKQHTKILQRFDFIVAPHGLIAVSYPCVLSFSFSSFAKFSTLASCLHYLQ